MDASQPDTNNNEGQLLKITVDLTNAPISDNLKNIAEEAIRQHVGFLGYAPSQQWKEQKTGSISMTYPKYNA